MKTQLQNTQKSTMPKGGQNNMENTNNVKMVKQDKAFAYAGSKERFYKSFQEIFKKANAKRMEAQKIKVETYIEGFSGSLASLFIILNFVDAKRIVINDINKRLINLYEMIKKDPDTVFKGFLMLEEKYQSLIPEGAPKVRFFPKERRDEIRECERFYKYIRTYINKNEFNMTHASAMLFILNHQFNGMYNENKKGAFNVSLNWSTKELNIEKIKRAVYGLHKLFNDNDTEFVFETLDIDSLISKYNNYDTLIYLDPPYINTKIQYNQKRKNQANSFENVSTHIKMLDSCSKYKYVLYSNNDHTDFQEYFEDSYVNFSRGHSISNKKSNKSKKEILGLRVNLPVNNPEFTPAVEEQAALKTGTDNAVVVEDCINNTEFVPVDSDYQISIATCFSGMGAPEYALKSLNVPHTSVFACDNNKYCRQMLEQNYNPAKIYPDIRDINGFHYSDIGVYVWGSPCQDLSILNSNRKGLKGNKSSLFFQGLRVLEELQPRFSVFENVPGLMSSNNGEDYKTVVRLFNELNYDVYVKKLNPVKLGGYTARVRVFFVLVRQDIGIPFYFPQETNIIRPIKEILIEGEYQYIDDSEFITSERPIEMQRGLIKTDYKWLGDKWAMYSRVLNIDYSVCPTLNRRCLVIINEAKGKRPLSIPELIQVQGYKLKEINFSGISNTQIKSMLGNTIEVTTMKLLLQEIVRIDKLHYNKLKSQQHRLAS